MKVVIDQIVAVKPGIMRVMLYTETENEKGVEFGADYEIALLEDDFVTKNDNEAAIDLDKFQLLLSEQIAAMQFTANLTVALERTNMTWELTNNDSIPDNDSKRSDTTDEVSNNDE